MSEPAAERCSVCGDVSTEDVSLPGVGQVCPACLMGGRFLGSSSTLRLNYVAERLVRLSQAIQAALSGVVNDAEHLAHEKDFDGARVAFLEIASDFMANNRPMLAVIVLMRALRLPGQSLEVYESLARASNDMDCRREAIQHLKTASWLAIKTNRREIFERVMKMLEELAPGDSWLERANERFAENEGREKPVRRCKFCGRTEEDAGPLITGDEESVCAACIRRVMSLDGEKH